MAPWCHSGGIKPYGDMQVALRSPSLDPLHVVVLLMLSLDDVDVPADALSGVRHDRAFHIRPILRALDAFRVVVIVSSSCTPGSP